MAEKKAPPKSPKPTSSFKKPGPHPVDLAGLHRPAKFNKSSPRIDDQPRMQTYSGRMVLPLDVKSAELDIGDIAHALALTNRYGGHSPFPLSVAQHSLMVCSVLPPELQLEGLLHDGAEAYHGDFIHPLKVHFPTLHLAESVLMERIAARYGFGYPEHPKVKAADLAVGATECAQFGIPINGGREAQPIAGMRIYDSDWQAVKYEFLDKFQELTRGA